MQTKKLLLSAFALLAISGNLNLYAQCKTFAKKNCLPQVQPYTHNGQLNTLTMFAGESAEMEMSFFSGQQYKLLICAQGVLGDVNFRILDAERKEIYNNKSNKFSPVYEFKSSSTQNLIIEVNVQKNEESTTGIVESGCVSVLVGFKQ